MANPGDYRSHSFELSRLIDSGKFIGDISYWKLFTIENIMRIVVNSVLQVQIGLDWWDKISNSKLRKKVAYSRANNQKIPGQTLPGTHDIYYIYLSDITKIIANTSDKFIPIVNNIDLWIVWLEELNNPRNLVGHMNWLDDGDIQSIRSTYFEAKRLLRTIEMANIQIEIPV